MIQLSWQTFFANSFGVIFTSLLIYSVFVFLRRIRSYAVFIGMIMIICLYSLAKYFNMRVTLLALQYFVSVSALVFALVFQGEIRKYFEVVGLIGSRQIKGKGIKSKQSSIVEIIRACINMAKNHTGALIVIQGHDDIERLLEGGTRLDGIISEDLIVNMFNKTGQSHDGAMVISENRISKFSVQLPLSTNFKEIGKHGTRHSAGLGLSEGSDALCIVVSEESGTISTCRDGKLKTLTDFDELDKDLDKFFKSRFPAEKETFVIHVLTHNFWLKVGALFFAIVLWIISKR